jgi:hypothetical protein
MKRLIRVAALGVLFAFSVSVSPAYTAETKHAPAKFKDSCHCVGCHAEYRWDVKTDDDSPPQNVTTKLTPSEIGNWDGPGGIFHQTTARRGKERQWFQLTGRVSLVKIEPDGDLHIQLVDEKAEDDDVNVVVEVPFGDPWCDIRKEVFSWTSHKFPIVTQGKKFTLNSNPVITVTGVAH